MDLEPWAARGNKHSGQMQRGRCCAAQSFSLKLTHPQPKQHDVTSEHMIMSSGIVFRDMLLNCHHASHTPHMSHRLHTNYQTNSTKTSRTHYTQFMHNVTQAHTRYAAHNLADTTQKPQHTTTHHNTPQHTTTHRNTPQHHRNTPQHTATHRKTPQDTATHRTTTHHNTPHNTPHTQHTTQRTTDKGTTPHHTTTSQHTEYRHLRADWVFLLCASAKWGSQETAEHSESNRDTDRHFLTEG